MQIKFEEKIFDNNLRKKLKEFLEEIEVKIKFKNYDYEESFINLPEDEKSLEDLQIIKGYQDIKNLFLIGIGGSHLPLYALRNFLSDKINKKIYFLEGIDNKEVEDNLKNLEKILETKDFLFIVISKSGQTLETIINFYFVFKIIKEKIKNNWQDYFIVLTEKNSPLDKFATENKINKFIIPSVKSGRFLVFSYISLIFLYLCRLDIEKFLKGAKEINRIVFKEDREDNFVFQSVLWIYNNFLKKKNLYNLFVFSKYLKGLALWYRQLIGESLGKDGKGIIPFYFLVNRDLHSVYQLLTEGYLNHFSNFLFLQNESNLKIDDNFILDLNLANKSLKEINSIIYDSFKKSFNELNFPFFETIFEEISEIEIGRFMEYKMLEIVFLAKLLEIDPFDQPGIESYKRNLKKFLS